MKQYALLILITVLMGSTSLASSLQTKGFLTFAYSKSNTEQVYQDGISEEGEFAGGSLAGLQFSSILNPKIEAFVQMVAKGDDGNKNFNFSLDIAHITYNLNNEHKLLLGKMRLPVFMISEHRLVGYLYPWIIPPEELYEIIPFEDIGANETFFGASLEGQVYRNGLSELNYRLYTGGSKSSENGIDSRVKSLIGTSIDYKNDDLELKFTYLNALSRASQNTGFGPRINVSKGRTQFYTAGLRYDSDDYLIMSEFSKAESESTNFEDIQSYYILGGIYLDDQKYLLHGTFSSVLPESTSDIDLFQESITLGANYFVDFSTVFKLELKRVFLQKPPAPDPNNPDLSGDAGFFERHPGKDVNIISLSVDTVF